MAIRFRRRQIPERGHDVLVVLCGLQRQRALSGRGRGWAGTRRSGPSGPAPRRRRRTAPPRRDPTRLQVAQPLLERAAHVDEGEVRAAEPELRQATQRRDPHPGVPGSAARVMPLRVQSTSRWSPRGRTAGKIRSSGLSRSGTSSTDDDDVHLARPQRLELPARRRPASSRRACGSCPDLPTTPRRTISTSCPLFAAAVRDDLLARQRQRRSACAQAKSSLFHPL